VEIGVIVVSLLVELNFPPLAMTDIDRSSVFCSPIGYSLHIFYDLLLLCYGVDMDIPWDNETYDHMGHLRVLGCHGLLS
jgi:hypothetical protein